MALLMGLVDGSDHTTTFTTFLWVHDKKRSCELCRVLELLCYKSTTSCTSYIIQDYMKLLTVVDGSRWYLDITQPHDTYTGKIPQGYQLITLAISIIRGTTKVIDSSIGSLSTYNDAASVKCWLIILVVCIFVVVISRSDTLKVVG